MKRIFLLSLAAFIFVSCTQKESGSDGISLNINEFKASLKFLSDDKLQGRLPGTFGGDIAAEYIASRFESLHLKPYSKESGYLQPVPIKSLRPDYNSASIIISGNDFHEIIKPYSEALVSTSENAEKISIEGELVFVGYGAVAPEYGWDDFKDFDVSGKIVVCLFNHPQFQSKKYKQGNTTYYGCWEYKPQMAFKKGAKGILMVYQNDGLFPYSIWQEYAAYPSSGNYSLVSKIPLTSTITEEAFDRVLKKINLTTKDLVSRADREDFKPFPLSLHLKTDFRQDINKFISPNVIGIAEGTEKPQVAIVFMAHYDHLGTKNQDKGDSIFNGAIDNASGVAGIICLAEYFSKHPVKRSVIFLATTAEEMKFQGVEQYLMNPFLPLENTIIGLNLDMMNFLGKKDSIALPPLAYTDAIEPVRQIAKKMKIGLKLSDFDNQYLNFRVESYPFALRDILVMNLVADEIDSHYPSLSDLELKEIINSGGLNYHEASDEIKLWFRYDGILQELEFAKDLAIYYANDGVKPRFMEDNPYAPVKKIWEQPNNNRHRKEPPSQL